MKSKFKVGDRVKIIRGTRYYGLDKWTNPADIVGIVSQITKRYIQVQWPGGANSYEDGDLQLADNGKSIFCTLEDMDA